ncbi:MAG TPA: hypothetical protein VMV46_15620 [Thermoanaerobaculia bacterium]|nr:hypothetical protein [Thermoanaerobaculia bacterium]
MIETAQQLSRRDLPPPVCLGVHAVFADGAYEELSTVAELVVTSNTIAHPSNEIDVAPLVAQAVEELGGTSGERRGR